MSAALVCAIGMASCQLGSPRLKEELTEPDASAQTQNSPPSNPTDGTQLVIDTISLPGTYPRATYAWKMHARHGTIPYHWKVEKG